MKPIPTFPPHDDYDEMIESRLNQPAKVYAF